MDSIGHYAFSILPLIAEQRKFLTILTKDRVLLDLENAGQLK